jgi:glycosylphosphatidylinositol transamidase
VLLPPRGATGALTFMPLEATALSLRRDPRLLRIPPYVSAFCIAIGVVWLLLLPLDDYSRRTYVSENALLPGQVHTYFGGSEQHIFRAFRHEVDLLADTNNYVFVAERHLLKIWRHTRG